MKCLSVPILFFYFNIGIFLWLNPTILVTLILSFVYKQIVLFFKIIFITA